VASTAGPAPEDTPGPSQPPAEFTGPSAGENDPAGEATAVAAGRPPPRRRGYWTPGLIAVAALTAIGVAFGAGDLNHGRPAVLHGSDVAQMIALGIQAQERTHVPPDVRCPATEPVRHAWQFTCVRQDGARQVLIRVVEIDNRGRLRWNLEG
jgi:hypothetical protein